ncbi:hypothetical protein ACQPVA_19390 [Clostridium butyricum]|uniref:hypothetical protein n=1 Tax=Clostridium butyricum TaxID=1492 RepID=UPI003D333AAC
MALIDTYQNNIKRKQIEINLENDKFEKEKNRATKKQMQLEEKRIRESEKKTKEILNKPTTQYINNGDQMNIASDNATIHATYNDKDELIKILENIKSKDISSFSKEEAETLEDSVDLIEQEFKNDEPKKGIIRMAIKGLISIFHVSSELTEPLQKLINFVGNNIK